MQKFIKDFSLFIKQRYHIVWSVEKMQKVKIQKLQGQKAAEKYFSQNVQRVIVKNQNLSNSKKIADH